MDTLSVSDAVLLVRRNLDESLPNGSVMYQEEDNESLDKTIETLLPDAINAVHEDAPVQLLDGEDYTFGDPDAEGEEIALGTGEDNNRVLFFTLARGSSFLRLVAFQAVDSPIVVTDVIGEATPEGRKQLNKTIRGRYDRPRLVQMQGSHDNPSFAYYSMKDEEGTGSEDELDVTTETEGTGSEYVKRLSFVRRVKYNSETPDESYNISHSLRQNIIDYLTSLVMQVYADERFQSYIQKASNYHI